MKRKALGFVFAALLAMLIVPAINLATGAAWRKPDQAWWRKSTLYNIDFALVELTPRLYRLGISTNPGQVLIGRDGWLYLGDQYQNAITVMRRAASADDIAAVREVAATARAWQRWYAGKGVRNYRIMIGPDKGSIYPEFMPDWAHPAADSVTDRLGLAGGDLYFDARPVLRRARPLTAEPLYYKTDTHWNGLGAWIAFREFSADLARSEPQLRVLTDRHARVLPGEPRAGGDLANMLGMTAALLDTEVRVELDQGSKIETEQFDFSGGRLLRTGGNPTRNAPKAAVLVKATGALNRARVLWLRDSFGVSLAPYMAATFSETLELDYAKADGATITSLVERFKPDYVFVTVVERDARTRWFRTPPP